MLTIAVEINRKEAVRRGLARQGKHVLQISDAELEQLDAEEREVLLQIPMDLSTYAVGRPLYVWDVTFEAAHEAIKARVEEKRQEAKLQAEREERERKEREKNLAEALALPEEKFFYRLWSSEKYRVATEIERAARENPENGAILARLEIAKALAHAANEEDAAQCARQKLASEEKEARAQASYKALLEFFIPMQSASVRERFDAGVLPREELRKLIREWLFESFRDYALFVRVEKSDVEHDRDNCYEPEVSIETEDLSELDAEEFELRKQLEKKLQRVTDYLRSLPGVTEIKSSVITQAVVATCATCDESYRAHGALVSIIIGKEAFSQRYAL